MDKSQKKTISAVVLGISILQIVIIGLRYNNLDNPLIPQDLVKAVRDYNLTFIVLHVFAGLFNVFYLVTKKYFWLTLTMSLLLLSVLALFKIELYEWFLGNSGAAK